MGMGVGILGPMFNETGIAVGKVETATAKFGHAL